MNLLVNYSISSFSNIFWLHFSINYYNKLFLDKIIYFFYLEYLAEAEYFSVDPYMRPYVQRFPLGITMIGTQVAKIIESRNPDFPVGKRVVGQMGWRTHTIINPNEPLDATSGMFPQQILPDLGDLPSSLALGVLGMPG